MGRPFRFGPIAIFSVILVLVIIVIVNRKPNYTAIRDEMQGNLDSLFLEEGYNNNYSTTPRPILGDVKDYRTVTGPIFYTTKYVPNYTFYFRIFYNIDAPPGTLNGANMIYTYDSKDGTGTPNQLLFFYGYNYGPTAPDPKVAYNWLVDKINTYNQNKHTPEIYNQLKLSSPQ
jgi:hypothetical protein